MRIGGWPVGSWALGRGCSGGLENHLQGRWDGGGGSVGRLGARASAHSCRRVPACPLHHGCCHARSRAGCGVLHAGRHAPSGACGRRGQAAFALDGSCTRRPAWCAAGRRTAQNSTAQHSAARGQPRCDSPLNEAGRGAEVRLPPPLAAARTALQGCTHLGSRVKAASSSTLRAAPCSAQGSAPPLQAGLVVSGRHSHTGPFLPAKRADAAAGGLAEGLAEGRETGGHLAWPAHERRRLAQQRLPQLLYLVVVAALAQPPGWRRRRGWAGRGRVGGPGEGVGGVDRSRCGVSTQPKPETACRERERVAIAAVRRSTVPNDPPNPLPAAT